MFPGTVSTVHSTFAFRRMQFRLLHSPWYSWNRGVSVEEGVFFRLCWSLHWIRRICGRRCHNKHVFELGFPFLSPWSLRWLLTWLNTNVGFRSPGFDLVSISLLQAVTVTSPRSNFISICSSFSVSIYSLLLKSTLRVVFQWRQHFLSPRDLLFSLSSTSIASFSLPILSLGYPFFDPVGGATLSRMLDLTRRSSQQSQDLVFVYFIFYRSASHILSLKKTFSHSIWIKYHISAWQIRHTFPTI